MISSLTNRKSKYNLNYNLFNKDLHSEKTYYLLGYLYSDGNINKNKSQITIVSKDEEIIKKLSLIIGNLPIKEYTKGYFTLTWYSKQHITELENLGCTENKSLVLKYPLFLNKKLEHHFIRGYFDGDGSVGLYERKGKDRRPSKVLKLSIAGTEDVLVKIKDFINNKGTVCNNKNIKVLYYSGNKSVINFCEIIYKDSTIFMERKFDIIKGFIPYRYFIDSKIEV